MPSDEWHAANKLLLRGLDSKFRALAVKLNLGRPNFRGLLQPISQHDFDFAFTRQPRSKGIVDVDYRRRLLISAGRGGEEFAFRLEIILHRLVIIEMVVRKVGEYDHVEFDTEDALLLQSMGT